jgi:alpha-ketoglutarate-dependent taurine dioxygenase
VQVRFERRRVLRGARGREGGYSADLLAAIAAFEAAAYTPGTFVEYALQANELLIIDNRRVLHARTDVVGGVASGRHLKRVKAILA